MLTLKVMRVTRLNFIKHIGTVRFWTPFILAFLTVLKVAVPLNEMAAHYQTNINGFSASLLLSDKMTTFTFFIGIFILFSDIPFRDNQQTFLIVRSGKRAWIFSQVIYIIIVSLIYFAFIFISWCLILLPNLYFDSDNWGKIINSLGFSSVGMFNVPLSVSQGVLADYLPAEGFVFSFVTAFATAVVLGVISFVFNLILRRNSGLIVSGMLIFMYLFVSFVNAVSMEMFYFSPLGWCSMSIADKNGTSGFPDIPYIVTVLALTFVTANIVLMIYSSKRMKFVFETKEDVL